MALVAQETQQARSAVQEAVQKAFNEKMFRVFFNPVHKCWQLGVMTRLKENKSSRKVNGIWRTDLSDRWAIVPTPMTWPAEMASASPEAWVDYMRERWIPCRNDAEAKAIMAKTEAREAERERAERFAQADDWDQWGKAFDKSQRYFFPDFWDLSPSHAEKKALHKRVDKSLSRKAKYLETGDFSHTQEDLADNSEGSLLHWTPNQ